MVSFVSSLLSPAPALYLWMIKGRFHVFCAGLDIKHKRFDLLSVDNNLRLIKEKFNFNPDSESVGSQG